MLSERILADLQASLLEPEDIDARELGNPERAGTNTPVGVAGYVIPYRSLDGKPVAYYRVKCFDTLPKYKAVKSAGNTVYFPRGFKELALKKGYVIMTEGEKKAACATKHGFPAVGFGGVDSWRNRTILLPEDAELKHVHNKETLSVKLPPGGGGIQDIDQTLATGLSELIDFVVERRMKVIICYDTDKGEVKHDVQRAAADLGFELRFKGLPLLCIKQIILPELPTHDKVGIDDFIAATRGGGVHMVTFHTLVERCLESRANFPRHPNPREYVNRKLQKTKMPRKEAQQVSLAVLCELDSAGSRLRNRDTDQLFYFHRDSRHLLPASLKRTNNDALADSAFSRHLYQQYGLGTSDMRVLTWLANQFTAEDPIDFVSPNRVCTTRGDEIYIQLNDGQYITVRGDPNRPWEIRDNGIGDVLFEAGSVEPIDKRELEDALSAQRSTNNTVAPWWFEVLKDVRLKSRDRHQEIITSLFYMSPFLNKWRGTQLPIEMIIGEAGTGKSSLYELRLNILLGTPSLRNSPQDLRDWHASIASSGGLHVTDNVHLTDKNLRQRLSDEMCRLVTEPKPHIEMRQLYTNTDLLRIPVQSVFAITAIQQPFRNADLVQRSFIIELEKADTVEGVEYDSNWANDQLSRFGGRVNWMAHQIIVLHKFLAAVQSKWNNRYLAKHRLINVEQSLCIMAEVLGFQKDWIPEHLKAWTNQVMADNDWILQGLVAYSTKIRLNGKDTEFSAADICGWAESEEDFLHCTQLTNARSLGRFLHTHKNLVSTLTGIKEVKSSNNRSIYQVFEQKAKA